MEDRHVGVELEYVMEAHVRDDGSRSSADEGGRRKDRTRPVKIEFLQDFTAADGSLLLGVFAGPYGLTTTRRENVPLRSNRIRFRRAGD